MTIEQIALIVIGAIVSANVAGIVGLFSRMRGMELSQAKDYHSKADIEKILDDKLKPINEKLGFILAWIEKKRG